MRKKGLIIWLIVLLTVTLISCNEATENEAEKNNNSQISASEVNTINQENEDEEYPTNSVNITEKDGSSAETDMLTEEDADQVVEEKIESIDLENAKFQVGVLSCEISLVKSFKEDASLDLPYVENKGYLYLEGTISNSGDEKLNFNSIAYVKGIDDKDTPIADADSWIDAKGIDLNVDPGSTVSFNSLYMYDSKAKNITLIINPDDENLIEYHLSVNVEDIKVISEEIENEDHSEMLQILEDTSLSIMNALINKEYTLISEYGYYTFVAANLNANPYDQLWFEAFNWESCLEDETPYNFGLNTLGEAIDLTCDEFFTTYFVTPNFDLSNPEIQQAHVPGFEMLSDSLASHFVKYESETEILYLIFEETYFNEFALTGIVTGQK